MPDSNREIWRRICDEVGSNILALCWSQIAVSGLITARDYVVHPMVQRFSLTLMQFFKIIFRPYKQPLVFITHTQTARSVQSWLEKHEDAPQHLP